MRRALSHRSATVGRRRSACVRADVPRRTCGARPRRCRRSGVQPSSSLGALADDDARREVARAGTARTRRASPGTSSWVSSASARIDTGSGPSRLTIWFSASGRSASTKRLGEVVDVDEVADLPAVAVDAQRLAGQRPPEERRQHRRRPHARAVRDAVAQHGERPLVEVWVVAAGHLGRDLRGDVEVAVGVGVERRGLVDPLAAVWRRRPTPCWPGSTRPASARRAASSTLTVPTTLTSVARGRLGDDVVDVGHGGQVEDRAAAVERLGQRRRGRARRPTRQSTSSRCGAVGIEHPHAVAGVEQGVDDVRADEAGATGDGDGPARRHRQHRLQRRRRTWSRLLGGHHRRDRQADVAGAQLLGAGQRALGPRLEHRLQVQRHLVDLARQADVVLLAQPLLEDRRGRRRRAGRRCTCSSS